MNYKVSILKFGEFPSIEEQERDTIIVGRSDGIDVCVRFFCRCDKATPLYIPFGEMNNEGGSQERKLIWLEQDKVLSLTPSIQVKGGCSCHYYITNNQAV